MSRSLGTLTLDLVARTGGWVQGMDKSQRTSRKWRRQVEKDMQQVSRAIKIAAAAAVGAFALLTRQGQTFVDSQAKAADSLDGTIDGLRAAQIVAGDFGISNEQLVSTVQRLNRELAGARDGSGNAAEALDRLGLSADQLLGMDVDQRMATIANAVSGLGLSSAETADLLRDLGVRNQELINVLRGGGDAFAAAREEVNEYGLSLSRVDAARVERANDAISRVPRLLEPIRTQLAVSLADPLKAITDQWLEMGKETGGFRDEVDSMVDSVITGLLFVVDAADGVKRAFQLAGRGLALMVIDAQRDFLKLADTIYQGPVEATNWLIAQINRIPGIDMGEVENSDFGRQLEANRAMFEEASRIARQDMQDILMAPMASVDLRSRIDATRADTPGLPGSDLDDLGDGLNHLSEAAAAAAKALEGFNPAMSTEVQDILERAGPGSTIDAEGQVRDAWGNTLPTLQRELEAELKRQVQDFQSQQNLSAGLEAAAQAFVDGASTAAKAAWASIQPQSADEVAAGVVPTGEQATSGGAPIRWSTDLGAKKVSEAASQVSAGTAGGASGGQHLGTLTLQSEQGGSIDVQGASSELTKWLADTLSGVSAGTS